jgi:hypothetical protein
VNGVNKLPISFVQWLFNNSLWEETCVGIQVNYLEKFSVASYFPGPAGSRPVILCFHEKKALSVQAIKIEQKANLPNLCRLSELWNNSRPIMPQEWAPKL